MSKRTAAASKAVRMAWEKERQLVLEGKGTRDWTAEQQQTIVEKGIAYDDEGKAYQGQHMKSVEAFPEYQNDPENIQLLTRQEHLDAHRGNWQNPTNWYYDPNAGVFIVFGDSLYRPPKISELSDPVYSSIQLTDSEDGELTEDAVAQGDSCAIKKSETDSSRTQSHAPYDSSINEKRSAKQQGLSLAEKHPWLTKLEQEGKHVAGVIWGEVKHLGRLAIENPVETALVILSAIATGEEIRRGGSGGTSYGKNSPGESSYFESLEGLLSDDEYIHEDNSEDDISEGDDYSEDGSESEGGGSQGSPKRAHKRNGHPRRYKSGKEVWIKPTIVHPDQYVEDDS